MKKTLILLSLAFLPVIATAQDIYANHPRTFISQEEAPHLEKILPAPPSLNDPLFFNDWCQYQWGKSIRDTERGALAVKDADINTNYIMERYSPAMHRNLTKAAYPVLYELLDKAHTSEMLAGRSAKQYFARVRPYQQFKEPTSVPKDEGATDFTSYPSGHTHMAWLSGLILTSIDPEHTEEIMKVAYEIGQSRVIAGFHYQSDVQAGRLAASVTFARLCAVPEFMDMLQAAKKEFRKAGK